MRRLLLFALLALACRRETPTPTPTRPMPEPVTDADERASLTNIARGATIVSRTGEAFLGVAADAVIDGNPESFWLNPPGDLPQSIVIALPARARIDRVGLRTGKAPYAANHVQFEGSLDGTSWRPLATIAATPGPKAQWVDIPPAEAAFLRVTVVDGQNVRLYSVLAHGAEVEPPHPGPIDGCWSLNGYPAKFEQRGGRIIGAVALGNQPLDLDGGGDGRVYRFVWIRGNDYGLALATVSPDGKHLTALVWHEEAIPLFKADSWFGERAPCTAPALRDDVPQALLRRVGRYSAFGDYLPPGDHIVAHEFREATPAANRQRAQRELERRCGDRLQSVPGQAEACPHMRLAAGSDAPRQQPVTEAMRVIYSSVDVEVRR